MTSFYLERKPRHLDEYADELRVQRDAAQARRDAAENAMVEADTGVASDLPAYDRAAVLFDEADDEIAAVNARLYEVEELLEAKNSREDRGDYYASR